MKKKMQNDEAMLVSAFVLISLYDALMLNSAVSSLAIKLSIFALSSAIMIIVSMLFDTWLDKKPLNVYPFIMAISIVEIITTSVGISCFVKEVLNSSNSVGTILLCALLVPYALLKGEHGFFRYCGFILPIISVIIISVILSGVKRFCFYVDESVLPADIHEVLCSLKPVALIPSYCFLKKRYGVEQASPTPYILFSIPQLIISITVLMITGQFKINYPVYASFLTVKLFSFGHFDMVLQSIWVLTAGVKLCGFSFILLFVLKEMFAYKRKETI